MELVLHCNRMGEIQGGKVRNGENLLLSTNSREVMERLLKETNFKTIGEGTVKNSYAITDMRVKLDCEFVYKEFTNKDEVEEGLERVITHIGDLAVEGFVSFEDKTITIYHYSKNLDKSKLEKLNEELFSGNLEGMFQFHIN